MRLPARDPQSFKAKSEMSHLDTLTLNKRKLQSILVFKIKISILSFALQLPRMIPLRISSSGNYPLLKPSGLRSTAKKFKLAKCSASLWCSGKIARKKIRIVDLHRQGKTCFFKKKHKKNTSQHYFTLVKNVKLNMEQILLCSN